VAAEAGAVGVPTIATRVGGIPDLIDDGETGLLVRAGDENELADAIASLAADPPRRRAMGEAARVKISSRFTTQRVARSIEAIYAEMRSRPRSSFGWSGLGFRLSPVARLALAVAARRLGIRRART
jgi:glycosyltransferase involved in cell wall biosynthesis